MSISRHYVLAAGGTGGHMIPAFALGQELMNRGHHVALVTDERGTKIPGCPDKNSDACFARGTDYQESGELAVRS